MKANAIGDFYQENRLLVDFLLNSGDPKELITPHLVHMDGIGLVIVVKDADRDIAVTALDAVVASSGTWRFDNGNFGPGDVGAVFTVAGATNGGNNGAKTILTVVDATHVTTATTSLVNETFDPDAVTVNLVDDPLQAAIKFEVSNNCVLAGQPQLNQLPNPGDWADITAQFSPVPQDITEESNQFVQCYPLVATRGKLTFTPTAGAGLVSVYYCAKGNR